VADLIQRLQEISPDEGCLKLEELNLQSPGSQGWHRYQILWVIRNDALAEFKWDLGKRELYGSIEFRVPGAVTDERGHVEILHTVGELQDIADAMRDRPAPYNHMIKRDIWQDYYKQLENQSKLLTGQSSFGHGGSLIRGGA